MIKLKILKTKFGVTVVTDEGEPIENFKGVELSIVQGRRTKPLIPHGEPANDFTYDSEAYLPDQIEAKIIVQNIPVEVISEGEYPKA